MIFLEKPENFDSKFEVVSCFVEYDWEILLLLRQDHKSEPDTFWVPAWKVNLWENINDAILREIFEETWLEINEISYYKKVFVKYPNYDFEYHIFHTELDKLQNIKINIDEHKSYIWLSPKEALSERLILDEDECIRMFYWIKK